jgi:hypothetical protein
VQPAAEDRGPQLLVERVQPAPRAAPRQADAEFEKWTHKIGLNWIY